MTRSLVATARSVAITAVLVTLVPALAHAAPQARAWEVCFIAGFEGCSGFTLYTQPLLAGDERVGTLLDLYIRHDGGLASVSALQALTFSYYAPQDPGLPENDALSPGMLVTPSAQGGATSAVQPDGWAVDAASFWGVPEFTYFTMMNAVFELGPDGLIGTQVIAGCGLGPQGRLDPFFTTALQTCGAGQSYLMQFVTDAWFDADMFRSIQVDHIARSSDGDLEAWTCTAYLDGSPSEGVDWGTGEGGDFCVARPLAIGGPSDPSEVPEPAAFALLLTGLAGVGAARRRRRTVRMTD